MTLEGRVAAILTDMNAALAAQPDGYGLIVTISRIAAEIGPRAELAARLREMHDAFCEGSLDTRSTLKELHGLREARLAATLPEGAKRPPPVGALSPDAVTLHFGATESTEAPPAGPEALATALYGPSYALAWLEGTGGAAKLFRLPLDLVDPIDAGAVRTALDEPSEFSDHFAAEVRLAGFQAYAEQAPSPRDPDGDSWAAGSMRVLFARVVDRLVHERALDAVPCAPEVYCGYALHDEPAVVLRIVDKRGKASRAGRNARATRTS
jgi:hypothetical protein